MHNMMARLSKSTRCCVVSQQITEAREHRLAMDDMLRETVVDVAASIRTGLAQMEVDFERHRTSLLAFRDNRL